MRIFNPGLVIKHDPKSENFLVANHARSLGIPLTAEVPVFVPKKKTWTIGYHGDQGQTPMCTEFGPNIALGATPIRHPTWPPMPVGELYKMNRAYDKSRGWNFDEGATVISAMENLKQLGHIKGYFWAYTMDELFRALMRGVVVVGTMITNSMFDRDGFGNVKIDIRSGWAGGHCYCISSYNPATNKLGVPQSWGDGMHYYDADEWYQLLRRDGEIVVMQEVRPRV